MKTLTLALLASVAMTSFAVAEETITILYPAKACAEIKSQEFSSGGTESSIQYLEILCVDAEGKYKGFITSWRTAAGFIGLGRWTIPESFTYVPYDGTTLKVN